MTQTRIVKYIDPKQQTSDTQYDPSIFSNIKLDGSHFIDKDNKKYGGITNILCNLFYSHYPKISKLNNSSKKKGTMIHRHIHHIIKCKRSKRDCKCDSKVRTRKVNKLAEQAISALSDYNIIPLDSEIPILSNKLKIGTAVDILGHTVGVNNRLLISIKTGYNKTLTSHTLLNMNNPLNSVLNHPLNHHQLQVVVEKQILKDDYNINISDAYILYLGHDISGNYHMHKVIDDWCFNEQLISNIFDTVKSNA